MVVFLGADVNNVSRKPFSEESGLRTHVSIKETHIRQRVPLATACLGTKIHEHGFHENQTSPFVGKIAQNVKLEC